MKDHKFGGDWTEEKLNDLRRYMWSYVTILKKARGHYDIAYVDCFAGTGSRVDKTSEPEDPDVRKYKDGSALLALKADPPFDSFEFVDLNPEHTESLHALKAQFPGRRIRITNQEANAFVTGYCRGSWEKRRALMFLDPYGAQVKFSTLQAVGSTGAVDLWLLFPVGVSVNRALRKDGKIPQASIRRLSDLFGLPYEVWEKEIYQRTGQMSLFDAEAEDKIKLNMDGLARFFIKRLEVAFPHVAPTYRTLRNLAGLPIYQLFFACANPVPKIGKLTIKIASDILKR